MSSTATAEATRDELIAEYVARDAVSLVHNRIRLILEGEDMDIVEKLPDTDADLVEDKRYNDLFLTLWPGDEDDESAEYFRAAAASCYMTARLMRAIVYHSDYLRGVAQEYFELADKFKRQAKEASGDA